MGFPAYGDAAAGSDRFATNTNTVGFSNDCPVLRISSRRLPEPDAQRPARKSNFRALKAVKNVTTRAP